MFKLCSKMYILLNNSIHAYGENKINLSTFAIIVPNETVSLKYYLMEIVIFKLVNR